MNEELGFELVMHLTEDGIKKRCAMSLFYEHLDNLAKISPKVIVFDGGSEDCSRKVIKHIRNTFKTDRVDLLISTTPDINHGLGLLEIITNLNVGEIWMHRPWLYIEDFPELVKKATPFSNNLQYKWKTGLPVFMEVEIVANEKGIEIKEPFTGLSFDNGIFSVLGPSKDYYELLLNGWRNPKEDSTITFITKLFSSKKRKKSEENNPDNNSDVTCLFSCNNEKFVFTEGELRTY